MRSVACLGPQEAESDACSSRSSERKLRVSWRATNENHRPAHEQVRLSAKQRPRGAVGLVDDPREVRHHVRVRRLLEQVDVLAALALEKSGRAPERVDLLDQFVGRRLQLLVADRHLVDEINQGRRGRPPENSREALCRDVVVRGDVLQALLVLPGGATHFAQEQSHVIPTPRQRTGHFCP